MEQGQARDRPKANIFEGPNWQAVQLRARALWVQSRKELGALGLFLLISLAVTYPLVLQLSSHLAACCDSWLYYWYTWWRSETLLGLNGDAFSTEFIYYPNGTPLYFEAMYHSVAAMLLGPVVGDITAHNLLFLSTYVLGAFGTYLLVLRLTGSRLAGIVAGVIFIFPPVRNQYLQFTNMTTSQWIPFLSLWFLKTIEYPTIRNALISAIFFVLVILVSGYFIVSSIILLLVIVAWNARRILNWRFARAMAVFGAASVAIAAPFMYPVLLETLSADSVLKNTHLTGVHSSDLVSFFVPSRFNPIYAEHVSDIYPRFITHFTEWESYLGIVAVVLALIGRYKYGFRTTGMWVVLLLVFAVLSLGPQLQILGAEYRSIDLPYYYLQELPVIESMRSPKRFLITGMLALAVLAGYGSSYLLKRMRGRFSALGVTALLVVLVLVDYWGWPRTLVTTDASVPQFYHEIAQDEQDYAILNIPLTNLINPMPLYHQSVHGKRLIGGYQERPPTEVLEFIQGNSFLRSIELPQIEGNTQITPEQAADAEKLFASIPEIQYVVLATQAYYYAGYSPNGPTEPKEIRSAALYGPWLESRFGPPVYQDDSIIVYQVQ